jgi:hypothetical protein
MRAVIALALACLTAAPALAQVSNPPIVTQGAPVDLSGYATTAQVQAVDSKASAAQAAMQSAVKTVNGLAPSTNGAVTVPIPVASTTMPPCISDSGSAGTPGTLTFAPFNHTHCSKARRIIATSATNGSYTYDYSAAPFNNPPVCSAVAEVAAGVTDVVNVQVIGTPTTTAASFLVNRANRSVASLLGLTVLSVPASPGATRLHIICLEP